MILTTAFPVVSPATNLQQVLDATDHDTVYLTAGDFFNLDNLVVSRPVNLIGQGQSFTRLHFSEKAQWGLRFDYPARYTVVEGVSLDMGACSGPALSFPHGLQQGILRQLLIHGTSGKAGVGIEILSVHPITGPNNNQYQTHIEDCDLSGFDVAIHFQGKNVSGAHPNNNSMSHVTFTDNRLHIWLEHGSVNTVEKCNFNSVRGPKDPRVLIDGYWCSDNTFRGNYWDNVTDPKKGIDQLCVYQVNSGYDEQYALIIEDNQPVNRFLVEGKPGVSLANAVRYLGSYKS